MLLAVIHDLKKDHTKANENYKKILDINKNFAPAANNLAWNYAEHGGASLDIALGLAQRARELSPDNPHIADTLGWIYYKKGMYPSAISLLRESSEKFHNKEPAVLYHLGMAYYRGGEKALAQETLAKALETKRRFPEAGLAKKALEEIKAEENKSALRTQ
jgi:tetratricopeptide (TPR) repeat protein